MTFMDLPVGEYFILVKDTKKKKGARIYYKVDDIRAMKVNHYGSITGTQNPIIEFGSDAPGVKLGSHVIKLIFFD